MAIQRMEHVGIVVDDLAAATEYFVELGLVPHGEGSVEGRWVDRVGELERLHTTLVFRGRTAAKGVRAQGAVFDQKHLGLVWKR